MYNVIKKVLLLGIDIERSVLNYLEDLLKKGLSE